MRRGLWLCALAMSLVAPSMALAQTLPTSEACVDCHLELEDERLSEPAQAYDTDVHAETGLGCLACHGSGGGDDLSPAAGFLAAPQRRQIADMCGRCHSDAEYMRQFNPSLRVDQVTEYWTSGHGRRLRDSDDPGVPTCVDCHNAHDIRRSSDPEASVYSRNVVSLCGSCHSDGSRMAGRNIKTDQAEKYASSVHGRMLLEQGDLSAPVCNDCHGNHGAAPPGLSSVRNVCGQCHTVMAEYFDQSGHPEIFEEEDLPGCALCHGYHAIEPASEATLRERSGQVCTNCHAPSDPAGQAFPGMAEVLDSLEAEVEASRRALEDVHRRGMEVSQALFELEDVNIVWTRARSAIHTFQVEAVREEAQAGLEMAALAEGRASEALDQYHFRRIGLALSSLIIVLLIVSLLLKVRELERAEES